jgi:hypothetical protein
MKKTVDIADEAVELARKDRRADEVSVGKPISRPVRRGARKATPTMKRNGFTIIRLPTGSPRVTVATVLALREAQETRGRRLQ